MDEIMFPGSHRHRRSAVPKDVETGSLFDEPVHPAREPFPLVPSQSSSVTSAEAAEKISPVFSGNKATCLKEIVHAAARGGTTRKMIADEHFEGKQNYVTGPVAVLIEEGFVFEDPLRINNVVQHRGDGIPIPKRIGGSAVLLPTHKGTQAIRRNNAAA